MCLRLGVKYVLSPCCYGQTSGFFARSNAVAEALSTQQFNAVASAADFTANADDTSFVQTPQFRKAKKCMQVSDPAAASLFWSSLARFGWCWRG